MAVKAMLQFDTVQKYGKDGMDAVAKSFGALSKGAQSAAVETAEYTKRAFAQSSSAAEKLIGARTFDRAVEIQSEFLRVSYEGFVTQAGKMGELATNTARDAFAPLEGLVAMKSGQASA